MTGDELVSAAAELAERILDDVSRPNQNWGEIAAVARELAKLAEAAAHGDAAAPGAEPQPPPEES